MKKISSIILLFISGMMCGMESFMIIMPSSEEIKERLQHTSLPASDRMAFEKLAFTEHTQVSLSQEVGLIFDELYANKKNAFARLNYMQRDMYIGLIVQRLVESKAKQEVIAQEVMGSESSSSKCLIS